MHPLLQKLQAFTGNDPKRFQMMAAPIVVVCVLALMVLPLPPFVLDLFFTFNSTYPADIDADGGVRATWSRGRSRSRRGPRAVVVVRVQ